MEIFEIGGKGGKVVKGGYKKKGMAYLTDMNIFFHPGVIWSQWRNAHKSDFTFGIDIKSDTKSGF